MRNCQRTRGSVSNVCSRGLTTTKEGAKDCVAFRDDIFRFRVLSLQMRRADGRKACYVFGERRRHDSQQGKQKLNEVD